MNKNLVKKYIKEINHYANDGKLLIATTTVSERSTRPLWEHFSCEHDDWNFKESALVIINDEYVEFRKALAEGKSIQEDIEDYDDHTATPSWVTRHNIDFTQVKGELRIKPEPGGEK